MTSYESISFTAGKDAGARISACVARLAALELVEKSSWWNRWRHRLMAKALVACAEELESNADESERSGSSQRQSARAEGPSA